MAEEAAATARGGATDEELRAQFASLDADGDGQLSVEEVQVALKKLGLPAGARFVQDLLSQYDRDGDQQIEFEEFRRYVQSKERRMRAVFDSIDRDGDGQLSVAEVHRAAAALGISVAPEDSQRMVELLDTDKDGCVDYAEFHRFVCLLPGAHVSRGQILSAWIDSASWANAMEYRLGHVPPSQPLERFLAGGVAGAVSRTVVAPLERLRTIMMADRSATRLGPVLRRMWADGGPRGLFRGNMATVIKVFPSSAIQFAVYDACKDVMLAYSGPGVSDLSSQEKMVAGMAAGAVACTATYPLEALRTQVSVAQGGAGSSYLAIVRSTLAERGMRGLYQGYPASLANNSVAMSLGFASYEALCSAYARWRGAPPSSGEKGLVGGTAALLTMVATMPLENLTRRLQVQGRPGFPRKYTGMLDCAGQMLRQEGISSFWRGSLSSFAKVAPSIAATRLLYESIVELRGIGGVRRYRAEAAE
ncbi:calcium-binding mitochondrial carrier S -3-like [Chlorella sorokiniana]|uniref:Calcium-binding mitochondrial carrier S-3-like n=1 Tax=Chlorella sorokiniana TaxID=3076 RepID=A0A2P6TIA8_CHLSO|nr:calcium-binding mitochondrial carrier S -3-like [Chlorella sorokiniana]|eukprot:PRW34020.1 calcium-binding mitochondrial carrier S -3-like [Chlorella sorokiniana]